MLDGQTPKHDDTELIEIDGTGTSQSITALRRNAPRASRKKSIVNHLKAEMVCLVVGTGPKQFFLPPIWRYTESNLVYRKRRNRHREKQRHAKRSQHQRRMRQSPSPKSRI